MKNVAGSGAKWVDVSGMTVPRLDRLVRRQARRSRTGGPDDAPENSLIVTCDTHYVTFTAPDGAVAECHPPFPESLAWPAGPGSADQAAPRP